MWSGGTVPPKTINVAGFYLLLLALHPECEVPCPNDFRDKRRVLKLMVGAKAPPPPYTAQQGVVIVRTEAKCLD